MLDCYDLVSKTIYILGGDGFVGSAYANVLSNLGCNYKVVNRKNYNELIGTQCDIFINANGNSKKYFSINYPKEDFQSSVTSVKNSLVDFKFSKYVFLSSCDVYPDSTQPSSSCENQTIDVTRQSEYGFHKYLAELCVMHSASNWLIVRQGGFVGSGIKKNVVYDLLCGNKIWLNPLSKLQFINTLDSALLVLKLCSVLSSNEIFNLTAKTPVSVIEIANLLDKKISDNAYNLPIVDCIISTDKISNYIELPDSKLSVTNFIQKYR